MRHEDDTIMDTINLKIWMSFGIVKKLIGDTTQNVMFFLAFGSIIVEYFTDIDMPVVEIIIAYGVMFMLYEVYKWMLRAIINKYETIGEAK